MKKAPVFRGLVGWGGFVYINKCSGHGAAADLSATGYPINLVDFKRGSRPVGNCRKPLAPGLGVVLILLFLIPARPDAHEIPNDARVQMLVKPAGQRMQVLIRVPMTSTADTIKWPANAAGYLDIENADSVLQDAVRLFLIDFLTVYENDRQLPPPELRAVMASLPSDPSFSSFDLALAHVTGPRLPPETEFTVSTGQLD